MAIFIKKYLKSPLALLVCLCLLLQFLPAPQPAQAGFWDTVKKILKKIELPNEVELTDKGEIKIGSWVPFEVFKKEVDGQEVGYNPFSLITLGESADAKRPLTSATTGLPLIAKPDIPDECELRIRRPDDEEECSRLENLSEEETIAHRKACTSFIRIQRAAADEAYLALKIFNATDPFSDCFFIKNCRSRCYLRFGEFRYKITWLDIAEFLLPTAWVSVIRKVMGVLAALNELYKAYEDLKLLVTDGLQLVNTFLSTFNYLTNMFTSLENIGGTMSASLGVAALGAGTLGELGILDIPGNALQFGAAASAAVVLAADSKGLDSMSGMLQRFSDNLLNFSEARSNTNTLILGIRQDLKNVLDGTQGKHCQDATADEKSYGYCVSEEKWYSQENKECCTGLRGAKNEPELAFLFNPNTDERVALDTIVKDFQSDFKGYRDLLNNLVKPGELPTFNVNELGPAREECTPATEAEIRVTSCADKDKVYSTKSGEYKYLPICCYQEVDKGIGCFPADKDEIIAQKCEDKDTFYDIPSITIKDPQPICCVGDWASFFAPYKLADRDISLYYKPVIQGKEKTINGATPRIEVTFDETAFGKQVIMDKKAFCDANNSPTMCTSISGVNCHICMFDGDRLDLRGDKGDIEYKPTAKIQPGQQLQTWLAVKGLTDPEAIKDVLSPSDVLDKIRYADGPNKGQCRNYTKILLDKNNSKWRTYWQGLASIVFGQSSSIAKSNSVPEIQAALLQAGNIAYFPAGAWGQSPLSFLRDIAKLDDIGGLGAQNKALGITISDDKKSGGYASTDPNACVNTELYIDYVYQQKRLNSPLFNEYCEDGEGCLEYNVEKKSWLRNFQTVYTGLKSFKQYEDLADPNYALQIALASAYPESCTVCTDKGACRLDSDSESWRGFWESIAKELIGTDALYDILYSEGTVKSKHYAVVSVCLEKTGGKTKSVLGFLARIEYGTQGGLGIDFYDLNKLYGIGENVSFKGMNSRNKACENNCFDTDEFCKEDCSLAVCIEHCGDACYKNPDSAIGGKAFIKKRVDEYRMALLISEAAAQSQGIPLLKQITNVLKNIKALAWQKNYLENVKAPTTIADTTNAYWQSHFWCAANCWTTIHDTGDDGAVTRAEKNFVGTYNPDLATYDWDDRVRFYTTSGKELQNVSEAVFFGTGPDEPIFNYTIEKDVLNLRDAANDALDDMQDVVDVYEQACFYQRQEEYFDEYEDASVDCEECPCYFRVCESWHSVDTTGHDRCKEGDWPSCVGEETCLCCEDESDCRDEEENIFSDWDSNSKDFCNYKWENCCEKCDFYTPSCEYPDDWDDEEQVAIYSNCQIKQWKKCDEASNEGKNTCLNPCNAKNQKISNFHNIAWGIFGTWQSNFGGQSDDLAKWDYFDKKYTYQNIQDIKELLSALNFVWKNDLADPDIMSVFTQTQCVSAGAGIECSGFLSPFDYECNTEPDGVCNLIAKRIKNAWRGVKPISSPIPTSASGAKQYIASLITSKILGQQLFYKAQQLSSYFYSSLSPEAMKKAIADDSDLKDLPQSVKDKFFVVIDEFNNSYTEFKTEVVDYLIKAVGFYIWPTGSGVSYSAICPPDIAEKGFLNRLACFEFCQNRDLGDPPDFSKCNPKRFEDLMNPLTGVEGVEEAMFWLTEAKQEINGQASVQESVNNLKPEIQSEVLQINTDLAGDIEKKAIDLFHKYVAKNNETPTDDQISFFEYSGDKGTQENPEIKTFDDFKRELTNNPLSYLEDQFTNIDNLSGDIKADIINGGNAISGFFWKTDDQGRNQGYNKAFWNIHGSRFTDLDISINGNRNLRPACSALGLIINGDPVKIEQTCQQKADGGELDTAWLTAHNSAEMNNKCDAWLKLDVDIADDKEIDARRTTLKNLRNCVGPYCIKCPSWFCTDPFTGFWGAGAMQKDPYCIKKCVDWKPGQGEGYVCDTTNNIIWETADFGQVSSNPTKAICEDLGFVQGVCTKQKVIDRCQLLDEIDCALFDTCTTDELEKQLEIQKWLAQSADNQCPKWLCLNENGLLAPLADENNEDAYCKEIRNGGPFTGDNDGFDKPGDGFYYQNRIIWDTTTHPTRGSQVWNGTRATNAKCAQAQQGLLALGFGPLDPLPPASPCSSLRPILSFCQHRITCNKMQSTCADWATQLQNSSADKPLMSWPPKKPPQDPNGYTKGYQGAKEVCIQTQGQMFLLDSLREATPEELDLIKLTDDCNELMRQKQLRDECNSFFLAKKALQNQCATASDIPKCQDLRNKMNSLCAVDNKQYASQACENNKIPDLLNIDYAKQEQVDRANVIKRLCIEAKDIRTPLGEIMKVFSILTGIQSGTAAHGGLVTSIKGSQAFYQNVKKFITMIEGLKGAMTKKYNETVSTKAASGGADIEWFKCVAAPAESQAGGKKTTGPKGGLVCPQVKTFFTQLQAQFAQIRQELHALDKARRKTESADLYLPWDEDKYIHLYDKFPVAYESITPMYERAEQLKKEAQFVWALATALNFANENCACGMSYCKLPFCISGLPLTLSPLKDPYCVLVWILRSPMVNMAERLAKDLDAKLECK